MTEEKQKDNNSSVINAGKPSSKETLVNSSDPDEFISWDDCLMLADVKKSCIHKPLSGFGRYV